MEIEKKTIEIIVKTTHFTATTLIAALKNLGTIKNRTKLRVGEVEYKDFMKDSSNFYYTEVLGLNKKLFNESMKNHSLTYAVQQSEDNLHRVVITSKEGLIYEKIDLALKDYEKNIEKLDKRTNEVKIYEENFKNTLRKNEIRKNAISKEVEIER